MNEIQFRSFSVAAQGKENKLEMYNEVFCILPNLSFQLEPLYG